MTSPIFAPANPQNLNIGPGGLKVDIPFIAKYTSPLAAVRIYTIDNYPGYSLGTGFHDTLRMCLCSDSRGCPDDELAGLRHVPDPQYPDPTTGRGRFLLLGANTLVSLIKGQTYHLLLDNPNADPENNYQAIDVMIPGAGQPPFPDMRLQIVMTGDQTWHANDGATPFLLPTPIMLYYLNGLTQGYGWYQLDPANPGRALWATAYGFGPAQ